MLGKIITEKLDFLRSIKQYRIEQINIYYLDKTWFNEGFVVQKIWQDKNITNACQGRMEGWSSFIKVPSGKGKGLIIVYIGSEDGFLKKGPLTFKYNKTGDYHEDMNADVFEDYFEEMLKYLPAGSVVVMDNASYHSRRVEKTPTSPSPFAK